MMAGADSKKISTTGLLRPCSEGARFRMRHHTNAFVGCHSLVARSLVHWGKFVEWKNDPAAYPEATAGIADDLLHFAHNRYDLITTAPPSKGRNLENYCCWLLCERLSSIMRVPFVRAFGQRKEKYYHGRYESLRQEPLEFIGDAREAIAGRTVLWVDDFLTTGTTALHCFEALREIDCHVDGLVWASF